jgi:hypothetical protein
MAFDILYRDGRDLRARPLRGAVPGWRTRSSAATWSSQYDGSRQMVWRRGTGGRARVRRLHGQG